MADDSSFEEAVREYLKPFEGAFNHPTMLKDHLDVSRFEPWVQEVSQYKPVRGSTVLSSGCASAGDLLAFMKAGASKVYGVEVSPGLTALARKRFAGTLYADALDMRTYDGGVLPYTDGSFDIVFSMHVVEHTQDPTQYVTELFRVLRPDGVCFLDVPNRYYPLEQHIQVRYIHYLPPDARDTLIRISLSPLFRQILPNEVRYKLQAYTGVHFPSAAQLMEAFKECRARYSLTLEDAFFHSYSPARVPFTPRCCPYITGEGRMKTTFRMVVRRAPPVSPA